MVCTTAARAPLAEHLWWPVGGDDGITRTTEWASEALHVHVGIYIPVHTWKVSESSLRKSATPQLQSSVNTLAMNLMQSSVRQQSVLPSSGFPTRSSSSVPLRQQLRLQHRFSGGASRTQLHSVSVQQRHGRRERSFTPPQAFIWTQGMVPDQSGKVTQSA